MTRITARRKSGAVGQSFKVMYGLPVPLIKIVKDGQHQFAKSLKPELVRFINPIPVMADTAPKFVFDFDTPGFGRQRLNPPIEEPATPTRGNVITGALLCDARR